MTLKELIEQLAKFDLNPNAEIKFVTDDECEDFTEGIIGFNDEVIHFG